MSQTKKPSSQHTKNTKHTKTTQSASAVPMVDLRSHTPSDKGEKKRHRYSKAVRVTVSIVSSFMILLSVLLTGAGGYILYGMGLIVTDDELQGEYVDSLPPESDDVNYGSEVSFVPSYTDDVSQIAVRGNTKNITNLLLLGLDGRSSYKGSRSDTMMIVSINDQAKTIKLISLMRDTLVTIPGRDRDGDGKDDYAKMNAAYAYGGFDLLSKTIEQNFRLDIDHYVGVNFVSFPVAVDAMGGVDIELTEAETTQICDASQQKENWERGFKRIGKTAGTYHLNGYQALQYARIRHLAGSDFKRTERQRIVISALMQKAKKMNFGQLNAILTGVLPHTVTNMSANQLMGYALNIGKYAGYTIEMDYRLPQDNRYNSVRPAGLGSCLAFKDQVEAVNTLHQWIYG